MFMVRVGLVFGSKNVQFHCSLQYSISISTVKVDPHLNLLYKGVVKLKNKQASQKRA